MPELEMWQIPCALRGTLEFRPEHCPKLLYVGFNAHIVNTDPEHNTYDMTLSTIGLDDKGNVPNASSGVSRKLTGLRLPKHITESAERTILRYVLERDYGYHPGFAIEFDETEDD